MCDDVNDDVAGVFDDGVGPSRPILLQVCASKTRGLCFESNCNQIYQSMIVTQYGNGIGSTRYTLEKIHLTSLVG